MNTDLFYEKLKKNINHLYPNVSIRSEQLKQCISPFKVQINSQVMAKIQKSVRNIYKWSRENLQLSSHFIENNSILMAYDFHLDSDNNPRLIEINTNASGFLIIDLIQKTHGIDNPQSLQNLKDSFINEWNLFSQNNNSPQKVIITDENIQQQKLYFEFLMYKEWMALWGWSCDILDASKIKSNSQYKLLTSQGESIDFLYNRLTDFYLNQYSNIKNAYEKKQVCLSPNPKEYFLLAHKKNLCALYSLAVQNKNSDCSIDWKFLNTILIETHLLNSSFWDQRKHFFFKPIDSYGGKGSYNGKSISKRKFQTLENYIAQKFVAPIKWIHPSTQKEWKVDIRAYVYEDQVQLLGGRIYQGQLTNFQTPLSGFCLLEYKSV